MNLSRSSFYYKAEEPDRMKAEADSGSQIEAICLELPRYGYRWVTHQLKHEGKLVNHKKVLRLMKESDLLCRVRRKWIATTNSNHHFLVYPNLIRGILVSRLNQLWIADITHIRIRTGFVFLAAILDAYSRKVIGYAISRRIDTVLTLEALRMAIARRCSGPGIILHSGQGVQYASTEYVDELKHRGFAISMSRKGNPYDNARMESFFKTLRYEEVYLCEYETIEDMMRSLPYFIEEVYSHKRLHSALDYQSPNDFEESMIVQQNNGAPCQTLLTLPV